MSPPEETRREVGKTYRVVLDDCCIQGEFTSRLDVIQFDEDGELDFYRFANGVELTMINAVQFFGVDEAIKNP